jgi:hypothetical protein
MPRAQGGSAQPRYPSTVNHSHDTSSDIPGANRNSQTRTKQEEFLTYPAPPYKKRQA